MTENEAREKRCCVGGCGTERPSFSETGQRVGSLGNYCVASDCVGWDERGFCLRAPPIPLPGSHR